MPDGWKPARNGSVQVLDSTTLDPRDLHVPGAWRILDRTPWNGWWLEPTDATARSWLHTHGREAGAQSGFIPVHGGRLVPAWLQLALP